MYLGVSQSPSSDQQYVAFVVYFIEIMISESYLCDSNLNETC